VHGRDRGGFLHRLVTPSQPVREQFNATIRARPAEPADETNWQEDGINGSIWRVSPPTGRSDESHHSHAGAAVKPLMGDQDQGVVGSDCSAGDHIPYWFHQHCWAHSLRALHQRKDTFPEQEEVLPWAKAVTDLSDQAVTWVARESNPRVSPRQLPQARVVQQHAFVQQRWAVCQLSVSTTAPQQVWCPRMADCFFPRTIGVRGGARRSCAPHAGRTPCALSGDCAHHPWQISFSQRIADAHGPGESLWDLAGARFPSLLSMPGSSDPAKPMRLSLNSYGARVPKFTPKTGKLVIQKRIGTLCRVSRSPRISVPSFTQRVAKAEKRVHSGALTVPGPPGPDLIFMIV
jgi:hypothetical protein